MATLNGSDGNSLSVPYQGVAGSIREHQVLPPDGASLSYQNVSISETSAITLPAQGSGQISELLLDIKPALGIPLLRAEVVPLSFGNGTVRANNSSTFATESIGQLQGFPIQWRPNNAAENRTDDLPQFLQFKWNGQLNSGSYAPEGSYKVVVRALRIFGNPDNTGDWDVSESSSFNITYEK